VDALLALEVRLFARNVDVSYVRKMLDETMNNTAMPPTEQLAVLLRDSVFKTALCAHQRPPLILVLLHISHRLGSVFACTRFQCDFGLIPRPRYVLLIPG